MTRLGRGVDDRIGPHLLDQPQYARAVANIEFVVRELLAGALQPLLVPARIALGAEEIGTHVVVHSMHVPAQCVEMLGHFRAD